MSFTLEGFEIGNRIGAGGFGEVWEARQVGVDRTVAIKVGTTAILDATDQLRFERECKALGRLSTHANIVTVYTSGQLPDGRPVLVLEYVDGDTLQKWALRNPSTEAQIMNIGSDLASALVEAHSHQILHRDLKPQNVLLRTNGEAILADFGIAQMQDGLRTVTGNVTASAAYAAPEVLDGNRATEQSDIYGIGICMLAAATQSTPFTEADDTTLYPVLTRVLTAEPPDLTTLGYSAPFNALVQRLLQKDPAARFANATEVLTELRRLNVGPDSYQRVTPTASTAASGSVSDDPATEGPEATPSRGLVHHTPQPTPQPVQPPAQQPPAQQPAPRPVAQVPVEHIAPATVGVPAHAPQTAAAPAQGYPPTANVPVGADTVGTPVTPAPVPTSGIAPAKVGALLGGLVLAALALFFVFGGSEAGDKAAGESSETQTTTSQATEGQSTDGQTTNTTDNQTSDTTQDTSSDPAPASDSEPAAVRTEPIPAGEAQQVTGSIDIALDFRDFPVDMVAGQDVSAQVTAMNGTCNSDDEFDLRILFLDPDGEQIGGSASPYIFGCRGYFDNWEAEVDGVHTLRFVSGGNPPATGTFEATIATLRRTREVPQFDDTFEIATTIDRARDSISYEVQLREDQSVTVGMTSLNGSCDSDDEWELKFALLDARDEVVGDIGSPSIFGCDAAGKWRPGPAGAYRVVFFSDDDTGSFEAVLGLPAEARESLDAGGRIWQVAGEVTIPRDNIGYEVDLEAGQQVSIDLTAMNGSCESDDEWELRIRVLDPSGEPVGDDGNAGIFGCRAYGPWAAEVDGTHTVLFWESGGTTGSFEATIGRLGG